MASEFETALSKQLEAGGVDGPDGSVDPFVGPPAIERVLDLSNTPTSCSLKRQLVFRPLDTELEDRYEVINPVPVEGGSGLRIGFANVYAEGTDMLADFHLIHDCPERLDVEGNRLYPYVIIENTKETGVLRVDKIVLSLYEGVLPALGTPTL